jgi:Flp pilus assembly protein TadG
LWKDCRAYSATFWAVFFGLVLIPLLALSMELGRYFYARAEVGKAADAAALAAAAEINQRWFEASGALEPTGQTWANAQAYASLNSGYLASRGIHAVVTGISVHPGDDTVLVQVSARIDALFPSVVSGVTVTQRGRAAIRALTH